METKNYQVTVEVVGPGRLYEVGVHLERQGHQLDEADPGFVQPLKRKSLGCNDEAIDWRFELSLNGAADLWCILSWVDPFGQAVWTGAYARKLDDPNARSSNGVGTGRDDYGDGCTIG